MSNVLSDYEISLETAQKWVKAYVDSVPPNATRAFLVSKKELEIVMGDDRVKYVRMYFGKDVNIEPQSKMILVPVDVEGNDMIEVRGDDSNIYDFTLPCPPTCNDESPLSPGNLPGGR